MLLHFVYISSFQDVPNRTQYILEWNGVVWSMAMNVIYIAMQCVWRMTGLKINWKKACFVLLLT